MLAWSSPLAALLAAPLALLVFGGLTLFFERKAIALAQKRLSISFLGRQGWAHLPSDVVKFWAKHSARTGTSWSSAPAGLVGGLLAYLAWTLLAAAFLLSDGGAAAVDFWDYQILAYFAFANVASASMMYLASATRSKYATLAAARVGLVGVFLEVFFATSFLLVYARGSGYSLEAAAGAEGWAAAAVPPLGLAFGLFALFESKRAPFDHTEAESELVAGHMVEFGGRALLLFLLCEYVHVYLCTFALLVFVGGGASAWPAPAPWSGPFGG